MYIAKYLYHTKKKSFPSRKQISFPYLHLLLYTNFKIKRIFISMNFIKRVYITSNKIIRNLELYNSWGGKKNPLIQGLTRFRVEPEFQTEMFQNLQGNTRSLAGFKTQLQIELPYVILQTILYQFQAYHVNLRKNETNTVRMLKPIMVEIYNGSGGEEYHCFPYCSLIV